MKFIKNIIGFSIIYISLCSVTYPFENKILFKINNEIITSVDLYNEVEYLSLINPNLKKLKKEKIFEIGINSLVREKVKKIELNKYVTDYNIDPEYYDLLLNNFLKKINFKTIDELENYLVQKDLGIEMIKKKINEEMLWNQLILGKFSKDLKIDKTKIKNEILKNNFQEEFLLSEIVFNLDLNQTLEEKLNIIKSEINSNGFSNAALIYSNSDTSNNGGNLGWIKLNSLNKKIKKLIFEIKVGEITKPIVIPGGFLLLKVEDSRKTEIINDIEKEIEIVANEIANKQLNQFSIIYFNKIKKEVEINEY